LGGYIFVWEASAHPTSLCLATSLSGSRTKQSSMREGRGRGYTRDNGGGDDDDVCVRDNNDDHEDFKGDSGDGAHVAMTTK